TATRFTGDQSLTCSGATTAASGTVPTATDKTTAAINFGTATTVTFTAGVATTSVKLYKAETATLSATGAISSAGANQLSVVVSAAALNDFAFVLATPQTNGATFTGTNTLTARDLYQNTVTTFNAATDNVTVTVAPPG